MTEKQLQAQDAAVKSAPRRKWTRTLMWIGGPAIVLVAAGWLYISSGRFASTDNAYVQADRVTIAPQVSGRVVEVNVRENQSVKQGDVLFRIDPEPLQIAAARMQAQVESVKSLLDAARSGYRSAQADVRSSAADLKYKDQQFQRMQEMRSRGLIAQQSLDDAANNLAAARAKQDSNNAAVTKAQNILGGLPETPDAQLAGYKLALAQLSQANLDLEHAVVRAPMGGVIGKTALQPGDFLTMGQAAMPLVANTLWVDANYKETDLTNVAVGQDATIEVDTFPGKKWLARVDSISPASGAEFSILPAQNATGNWVKIVQRIPVRLAIEEPNHDGMILRAGMSAVVEIDTGKQNSILGRWQGGAEPAARVAQNGE
ncbi:MAG TPA: HlyD family secretion protein [Rhodanobacteraceae bacterium]|jgi:membrane fusion protein (multidrug efflux system)|nr:HlyD family secretion protein [Rhodanobacteraceae bacterium]